MIRAGGKDLLQGYQHAGLRVEIGTNPFRDMKSGRLRPSAHNRDSGHNRPNPVLISILFQHLPVLPAGPQLGRLDQTVLVGPFVSFQLPFVLLQVDQDDGGDGWSLCLPEKHLGDG